MKIFFLCVGGLFMILGSCILCPNDHACNELALAVQSVENQRFLLEWARNAAKAIDKDQSKASPENPGEDRVRIKFEWSKIGFDGKFEESNQHILLKYNWVTQKKHSFILNGKDRSYIEVLLIDDGAVFDEITNSSTIRVLYAVRGIRVVCQTD